MAKVVKETFVEPGPDRFVFSDSKVDKKYEAVEVDHDFQIRLPSMQWHGQFSDITETVAEQLLKEKYNRIRIKK